MRFPIVLHPSDSITLISQGELHSLKRVEMDLLSRSGTPMFVSIDPGSLGTEQKAGLRETLQRAAWQTALADPLDWMETTCPSRWRFGEECTGYDWFLDWR